MTRMGMSLGPVLALAATVAILAPGQALADRQLAIGAAGGFFLPEGAQARPVYTFPRGHRWDPVDSATGFREPIYTTPRGYRYIYVRGYQFLPPRPLHLTVRKHRVKVAASRKRVAPCVTDLGFGRYESCR